MQVLASHGQRIGQRHRVVNIHRRCDMTDRLTLEHALEQVLDRAAGALFSLEQPVRVTPCLDRRILADGIARQVALRIDVGAVKQRGDRIHVLLGNLSRGLHALYDHDTDRRLRKQLPKRILGNKALHTLSLHCARPSEDAK